MLTPGEAWRLTQALCRDPSSQVAASVAGWEHPLSQESQVLADLYDLTHKIAAGKKNPKRYPRPWDKTRRRYGKATRPQAEIRAALAARGHGRILHRRDRQGRLRDGRGRFTRG